MGFWKSQVPLTQALFFVVGSMLLVSGGTFVFVKRKPLAYRAPTPDPVITSIIQTGPQKQSLPTDYLAGLLQLSIDKPMLAKDVDCKQMQKALAESMLIRSAKVKCLKPESLYIDYELRQPIAWLEDYENVAIDAEGHLFPFSPFFSPKNLPSLYLGLAPFGMAVQDKPKASWKEPLTGPLLDLGFSILRELDSKPELNIVRIDLSKAFAKSVGRREVVLITQDYRKRLIRLNPKTYSQALRNYLTLRPQLLAQDEQALAEHKVLSDQVLDFRLDQLAFIPDAAS